MMGETDFDDLDTIPEELKHKVKDRGPASLGWVSPNRQLMLAGLLGTLGMLVFLVGVVVSLALEFPLVLHAGMTPLLAAFLSLLGHTRMELVDGTVRYNGWVNRRTVSGQRIQIHGHPGKPVTVAIDGTAVLTTPIGEHGKGWTYDALTWFAERLARDLGVSLEDHRDRARWDAYLDGAPERANARFEVAYRGNLRKFPSLHGRMLVDAHQTWEPGKLVLTCLDGRGPSLALDATSLVYKDKSYPLHAIQRVEVLFRKQRQKGPDRFYGRIALLYQGRRWLMLDQRVDPYDGTVAGQLHWIAERIRQAMREADPARATASGSVEDVPEELRRMAAHPSVDERAR